MLLFRGEEHIDRWCAARGVARGATLTLQQGWHLGQWYSDRLNPDWRRRTLDEAADFFARVGLTGAFWSFRHV